MVLDFKAFTEEKYCLEMNCSFACLGGFFFFFFGLEFCFVYMGVSGKELLRSLPISVCKYFVDV